jgi:hypothetical protein
MSMPDDKPKKSIFNRMSPQARMADAKREKSEAAGVDFQSVDALADAKLGKWPARTVPRELAHLPTQLLPGETLLNLAIGDYKDRLGKGLLALTDRRLIFVESSGMGGHRMNVEDIPLSQITSLTTQLGAGSGTIRVSVAGNTAEIHTVQPKERVDEIAGYVRQHISGGTNTAAPAQPDVMDQLKKLAELRDAGVLSAAEFDAKKMELLARL